MPSPAVLADLGVKAVKDGKNEEGIKNLTEALRERPAPLWLLERSKAYLRTGAIPHALRDAERALRVAFDRANRDQMVEAQIRRAVAYFRLARFADADVCAFWALRLLDGARATEDDGQTRLRDEQGDYAVRAADIQSPTAGEQDGLSVAMKSGGAKSKETQLKNQAFSWRVQALAQLEKLPPGDPGRKVSVKDKYPNPSMEEEEPIDIDKEEDTSGSKPTTTTTSAPGEKDGTARKASWEELWNQYRALHTKNDVRSSFYQTDTTLNVDIFVKNVPKEEFEVDARDDSITLGPIPNTHSGQIHLFLYGKINPDETKYTVKSMKIELVLKKDTPGKWPTLRKKNSELVDNLALVSFPQPSFNQFHTYVNSLGYSNPEDLNLKGPVSEQTAWYDDLLEKLRAGLQSTSSTTDKPAPAVSETPETAPSSTVQPTSNTNKDPLSDQTNKPKVVPATTTTTTTSGPAYPTSSKKGPKNWDKIDELDDDGEDKDGGGDVDSFFKTLYQNADPDTRRAMMKSYVESNGTSLSTSWSEAKDKTYSTVPPDGSEAKKW